MSEWCHVWSHIGHTAQARVQFLACFVHGGTDAADIRLSQVARLKQHSIAAVLVTIKSRGTVHLVHVACQPPDQHVLSRLFRMYCSNCLDVLPDHHRLYCLIELCRMYCLIRMYCCTAAQAGCGCDAQGGTGALHQPLLRPQLLHQGVPGLPASCRL